MRAAVVLGLSLVSAAASAQPRVTAHGNVREMTLPFAPPDGDIHLYLERDDAYLDAPLTVDVDDRDAAYEAATPPPASSHTIGGMQTVRCYLVHFEADATGDSVSGDVRMEDGAKLLGIAFTDAALTASDVPCRRPDVMYPDFSAGARGIAFSDPPADRVAVSDTGRRVEISLAAELAVVEQMRLIVGFPEPADAGMTTADAGDEGRPAATDGWDYRGSGGCTCSTIGVPRARSPIAPLAFPAAIALVRVLCRRRR